MKVKPTLGLIFFSYPDYPRKLVERFIEESLKAVEGIGVGVVEVGRVFDWGDARRVLEGIKGVDVDGVVAVLVSWVEAPNVIAVLREVQGRPILLWSHTMFEEGGELLTLGALPGFGVVKESLAAMGYRFSFLWGMPWEEKVREGVGRFARAAHAATMLSRSKIGLLGYASMGMYTGTIDHVALRSRLGPEIEHLDQYVLVEEMGKVGEDEVEEVIQRIRGEWEFFGEVSESLLETSMRMYLALKRLVKRHGWSAITVKCQYELSRVFGFAPCVPLSMLGDEVTASCEGDIPLLVTQLILHYLTGEPTSYGDVHLIADDHLLLGACGFAPFSMASGKPRVGRHTALYEGLLNSAAYRPGKVTLARLGYRGGEFLLHYGVGEAGPPEPFREVGCPPYPSMRVELYGDHAEFGKNMLSQHYAIVYGDVGEELRELCEILDIKPVRT